MMPAGLCLDEFGPGPERLDGLGVGAEELNEFFLGTQKLCSKFF